MSQTALQIFARSMPPRIVQSIADAALRRVLQAHPRLFDRLDGHARKTFAFVPTDLPFAFRITPMKRRVEVVRPQRLLRADIRISGPIATLLLLAEGRLDGDAEFFARGLAVDGDMEAALALRNAMDDCRIDLPRELAGLGGPLARPVEALLKQVRRVMTARSAAKWN